MAEYQIIGVYEERTEGRPARPARDESMHSVIETLRWGNQPAIYFPAAEAGHEGRVSEIGNRVSACRVLGCYMKNNRMKVN